jgi:NAD(P)-dependent dehydrogenase (short-subunit alcohol dehydrogenase family)
LPSVNKKPFAGLDFSGQVALITGGASGIGFAVAQQLYELGAKVAIADLNNKRAVDSIKSMNNVKSFAIKVDVQNPTDANRMVEKVINKWGKIDILVHSAGVGIERSFLETTPEEWKRLIDIDLSGTFYCCQAVAKEMKRVGYGRIVNLASTAGLRGGTGRAAYGAAKGGVIALTKVMAVELAEFGITVNALAPGAIDTELVAEMHSNETRKTYQSAIPMDRYGTPDETAFAAIFLASEQARYINGHILGVDGGFLSAGIINRNKP